MTANPIIHKGSPMLRAWLIGHDQLSAPSQGEMDDDESEVNKCLELFGWSWLGPALTITTILEYIGSGERWFKCSDGH